MDQAKGRVATGVKGLDSLLMGGIPEGNHILLGGGPGAGKSLLSFEILYRNAKRGVPCAFVALEEDPKSILKNAKLAFPKMADIDALIKGGKLVIGGSEAAARVKLNGNVPLGTIIEDIEGVVESNNAKVVAIDSASLLMLLVGDVMEYRKSMVYLVSDLHRMGVTSIITLQVPTLERSDLQFTPEFFVFDGIIALYNVTRQEKRQPIIEVIKMRGSSHSRSTAPYDIKDDGFSIFSLDDD